MTARELKNLHHLLTTFDAPGLGEGDVIAGANKLAAMATTIPNIARPGSGIQKAKGGRMRIGTSLLVSGSLSSSLVTDDVVTEACIIQNNLTAQLRRLFEDKLAETRKEGLKALEFPNGPNANPSENALFNLQQKEPMTSGTIEEEWVEVVADPPNLRIEDLAARPKLIVTASSPAGLEKQLVGLHLGHPLVLLGLNRPAGRNVTAVSLPGFVEALHERSEFPPGTFDEGKSRLAILSEG